MLENPDKIKRNVEHGLEEGTVQSPMAPPAAEDFMTPGEFKYEELASPLQNLFDDHKRFIAILGEFETALNTFRQNNWQFDEMISNAFKAFFRFIDEHTILHNAKEEKGLFPILKEKLIATGECSPGPVPFTPCDVMEDDHLKVLQAAHLVFNLLGLGAKMKDADDRALLMQTAAEQGREIVETMRLHILKENQVLFPLAQKLIKEDEFKLIEKKFSDLAGLTV